jgi:glycyl-tRNA synthetase beta subunit
VIKVAESKGGRIPDDAGLLEEVTNLVEQPTALLGNFEQKYLALPKDVLITVMKKHQRYFPVWGKWLLPPLYCRAMATLITSTLCSMARYVARAQ